MDTRIKREKKSSPLTSFGLLIARNTMQERISAIPVRRTSPGIPFNPDTLFGSTISKRKRGR